MTESKDSLSRRLDTERLKKRYMGPFAGIVVDRIDPLALGRIRLTVPEIGLLTPNKTDWAFPMTASLSGKSDEGNVFVPQVDAQVWVFFRNGDPNKPVYSGGFPGRPLDVSDTPTLAQGAIPASMVGRQSGDADSFEDAAGSTQTQKTIPFAAVYPDNNVLRTSNGLVVEHDDTATKERHLLYHPIGSWTEIDFDGDRVDKTIRDHWVTVTRDEFKHVSRSKYLTVETDDLHHVKGKKTLKVVGAEDVEIGGISEHTYLDNHLIDIAQLFQISVGGDYKLTVDQVIQMIAAAAVNITGVGVNLDGGSGSLMGVVTKASICAFTGAPHPDASSNVSASH